MVFKLVLNEVDRGEFFFVMGPDREILMRRDDFDGLGLRPGLGRETGYEGDMYRSIRSVEGIQIQVDEQNVVLRVTVPAELFQEKEIDTVYKKSEHALHVSAPAAFLNYGMHYDRGGGSSFFGMSGEGGVSAGDYSLVSTFSYQNAEHKQRLVRHSTSLTYNDRSAMRTIRTGDVRAFSGLMGSGLLLGGLSIEKNFSVDPGFLQYPALDLSGTVETPSDVEVYLNGALVRKDRLSPGRYTFHDVPATVGLGDARLVLHDDAGREHVISIPYYYSNRLLRRGLHEYRYSIGFARQDPGQKSFNYGKPAFLAFHNYGLSERFKIGYGAELSENIINIRPAFTMLAARAGIIDGSLGLSSVSGRAGVSGYLAYAFQSRAVSANIAAQYASRDYSTLAIMGRDERTRYRLSGSAGLGGRSTGFITGEYSYAVAYDADPVSVLGMSYSRSLTKKATFVLTATNTMGRESSYDIYAGIHIYLGRGVSGTVNHSMSDRRNVSRINIQKGAPSGGGLGYRVEAGKADSEREYLNGHAVYQNNYGVMSADYSSQAGNSGTAVSISGGAGYIGGSFFLSRTVNDSFALVKVGNLEGVRVYYYGNEVGRTDSNGEIVITDLQSFHNNRIGIESRDIPINYKIGTISQFVSPPLRSGSLLTFDVHRIQGIAGSVYIMEGNREVPAEFASLLIDNESESVQGLVGRGGEFYIENVQPGEHRARLVYHGRECGFLINIPESEEIMLDIGKLVCR